MRKVGSPRVARIGGAQIPLGTTSPPYNIESLVVIFSPVLFEGSTVINLGWHLTLE